VTELTPNPKEEQRKTIPILASDTPEHAHAIKEAVDLDGVTIDVVEDREHFDLLTSTPESVPEGNVLIFFKVRPDKTVELMQQITEALNSQTEEV
jgi:hypothetical protein